jgi:catechol 2,3-dioxygenase-like lactoylglutathione lyase family enzyme
VPDFPALAHLAVTVTDLERSTTWYSALLGSDPVLDEDEPIGGFHHISFACSDRAELETWVARLDELGVTHGGIVDAPYGSGLSFRDPDNIALEFFAPPS